MIAIDNKRIARCHADHTYVATECRGQEYAAACWDDATGCVLETYTGLTSSDFQMTFHRATNPTSAG